VFLEVIWAVPGTKRTNEKDEAVPCRGTTKRDVIITTAGQPKALAQLKRSFEGLVVFQIRHSILGSYTVYFLVTSRKGIKKPL
jgi:hypothetical protein